MDNKKERDKVWKCLHCLFMKRDPLRRTVRLCFFGGTLQSINPDDLACDNFMPSRRSTALMKYKVRVEAGLVGGKRKKSKDKGKLSAKEMLERVQTMMSNKAGETRVVRNRSVIPAARYGSKPFAQEERTSAFREQMCAGRCCKMKDVCQHYESWIEHGKPLDEMNMIASVAMCINDNKLKKYSRFKPVKGANADDVKEYQDTL